MKKKNNIISFLIVFMILFVALPTTSKTCVNLLENPNFKFNMVDSTYILKSILSIKTYTNMLFNITNPVYGVSVLILIGYPIMFIIHLLGLFKDEETYTQTDEYGSHGTSRWQTVEEIKENYYKDDLGWFVGGVKKDTAFTLDEEAGYISTNGDLNVQTTVIGPPGSDKTTGFVLPNIFHLPQAYIERNKKIDEMMKKKSNVKRTKEMPDLIVTDPKSELFRLTANDLKKNGYDVHILDFINLKYGDSINPLDFIENDKELMEIAKGYVSSVDKALGQTNSNDTFFPEQEGQVLAALMGFVLQKYKDEPNNKSFDKITKVLVSKNVADPDLAELFFKENNIQGAAEQFWNNFKMVADSERTRASILGGLASKLQLFAIDGVKNITSTTTIDITKIGTKKEKPMALFILMPDGDRTFAPIINVVINIILKQLYKTAYKTNNRLENPVYMILEEMANIGKIDNIKEMMGTMRGRRIYPMMIWQSLIQMKNRYPDCWEDILSMCDTQIYLGVNDNTTAKYCSEQLGKTTIRVQGVSAKEDTGILKVESNTQSKNYLGRCLLLPDECKRLDNKKLIMIQRAHFPALFYKIQYRHWEDKWKICEDSELEDLTGIAVAQTDNYDDVNNITEEDEDSDTPTKESNSLENATIDKDIAKQFEE